MDETHWYDLTRPVEWYYNDPGQREPIHVTDHTQSELTEFGHVVIFLVVAIFIFVMVGIIRKLEGR